MKNILIILIGLVTFTNCSKNQSELPTGHEEEKLLSLEYTQVIEGESDETQVSKGINLNGESMLIRDEQHCELSSVLYQRHSYYSPDRYENGLGFRLIFNAENCPSDINKEVTDQWFRTGESYAIGNESGEIEISLNRNEGFTSWKPAAGRSFSDDNEESSFTIVSTEEYSWANSAKSLNGKLIEVEFNCQLRRTYGSTVSAPAELISINEGKAIFFVEYGK